MTGDRLQDLSALEGFLDRWGWTGSRRRTRAELDAVRSLRPLLRRLWELPEDELAREVNQLLRDANALPQLVAHDGWGYHLHATAPGAPLADRMAVEAAMAFVDVVRQHELDRLRICAAPDCNDVYVDMSKNRSRRFCSQTCSNRIGVASYRARHGPASRPTTARPKH